MNDKIADIPIYKLIEPAELLRLVDRDSVEYMELVASLKEDKVLNSLLVRPAKDGSDRYEIIDGFCRFTGAKEVGIESLPCIVKQGLTDEDCLALQLKANAISLETTPAEYAARLHRILRMNPDMTLADLSVIVKKSPDWIGKHLKVLTLPRDIRKAVDRGELPLRNAYKLALIPSRLQRLYVDQAKVMSASEFGALASSVVKQYKEAIKQGKMEAFWTADFKPTAYLRALNVVKREYEHREVGPLLLAAENCRTPLDGFYLALRWAMRLDRRSIEEQEAKARRRSQDKEQVPDTESDPDE